MAGVGGVSVRSRGREGGQKRGKGRKEGGDLNGREKLE